MSVDAGDNVAVAPEQEPEDVHQPTTNTENGDGLTVAPVNNDDQPEPPEMPPLSDEEYEAIETELAAEAADEILPSLLLHYRSIGFAL